MTMIAQMPTSKRWMRCVHWLLLSPFLSPNWCPSPHDSLFTRFAPHCTALPRRAARRAQADDDAVADKFKKAFKPSAAKMEGVGTGALAAAQQHKKFDLTTVISSSPWKEGEDVPYGFLAATFDNIAPESKRLTIISMLTNTFRAIIQLSPADLLPAVYLCLSKVRGTLCCVANCVLPVASADLLPAVYLCLSKVRATHLLCGLTPGSVSYRLPKLICCLRCTSA